MKYCYQCGRHTGGKEPLFCQHCGSSYDVRLCPRHHANPRHAEFCSQCGSSELSVPQPQVAFVWKAVEFLAKVLFGLLLGSLSLAIFVMLLQEPQIQNGMLALGILLGLLWWLWSQLPEWFRKLVRRSWRRKEGSRERRD